MLVEIGSKTVHVQLIRANPMMQSVSKTQRSYVAKMAHVWVVSLNVSVKHKVAFQKQMERVQSVRVRGVMILSAAHRLSLVLVATVISTAPKFFKGSVIQ
jgi:hypothetical protein